MTTLKNEPTSAESAADLDLMRYHDGDLDELAAEDVERLLAQDDVARDKLATMALLGGLLRDEVDADTRGDSVIDAVMAGLDEVDAEQDGGGEREGAEVVQLSERKEPPLRPTGSIDSPANDNARSIYVVAAAAAAVAIGLFFWGSTDPTHEVADNAPSGPTSLLPEPAASVAVGPSSGVAEPTADSLAAELGDDSEGGVEIASVDFGSQSGSVFYVSSGPSTGATAVVWVTDLGDDQ